MKEVAVNDANILIDFYEIGLLETLFDLELEMCTTDLVLAEITDESQSEAIKVLVEAEKLMVHPLTAEQLLATVAKHSGHARLSLQDCSAWQLAEDRSAILLTGDGVLRKVVKKAGVEVHGSLWLLDEMLQSAVLTKPEACGKLRALMETNPRLPGEACRERLRRWCSKK